MREGKYVEELHKYICKLPDKEGFSPREFVQLANVVAHEHPIWYERFRIRTLCVKGWKWVTSGKWFDRSKKRDGSSGNGEAAGSSTSQSSSGD